MFRFAIALLAVTASPAWAAEKFTCKGKWIASAIESEGDITEKPFELSVILDLSGPLLLRAKLDEQIDLDQASLVTLDADTIRIDLNWRPAADGDVGEKRIFATVTLNRHTPEMNYLDSVVKNVEDRDIPPANYESWRIGEGQCELR